MRAYIINLDSATDRWASVSQSFAGTQFDIHRVSGVNGHALQLPIPEYSEGLYRWFHGRPTSLGHVGCYLSHVKAMREFLTSEDDYALIAEDDLTLEPDFEAAIQEAMHYHRSWNILRLTGLSRGKPAVIGKLFGHYQICIGFGRLKGTGAYVVDRRAAEALVEGLIPMRLPIDHAMDREWCFGLSAAYIYPFPASQTETGFKSSIQIGKSLKLSSFRRYLATYPYQVYNEISRWLFRGWHYLRA
ncbi:MAG: glycosyltransferase family 25 protein [Chthoniobacterales bacterium]